MEGSTAPGAVDEGEEFEQIDPDPEPATDPTAAPPPDDTEPEGDGDFDDFEADLGTFDEGDFDEPEEPGGQSIADAAAEGEAGEGEGSEGGEEPDEDPGPPPIQGTGAQLSMNVGGSAPDSSTLKVRGGSIPIEGEFAKGEVVELVCKVQVSELGFIDKVDDSGNVTATERRHIARIRSARRA